MTEPIPPTPEADHHYVPKFYLKGFMGKQRKLWVHEKGQNAPRESTPKHEGHRANYYVYTDRGYPDDQAERLLQRTETIVSPTIRKLANPQFVMNETQRSELYTFVAIMYVRVPAYREFIDRQAALLMKRFGQDRARDREAFYADLKEAEAKLGKPLGVDPEKMREFLLSDNYTVTQRSAGYNLLLTFRSCLTISGVLETEYHHDIYYAPSNLHFVTGDNPIVTIEPDTDGRAFVGAGFGRIRTQVLFPLNKRACLILRRHGRGEKLEASPFRVQRINEMVMRASQKYLYAPEGTRRTARIFNQHAGSIRYGENAFIHPLPPMQRSGA